MAFRVITKTHNDLPEGYITVFLLTFCNFIILKAWPFTGGSYRLIFEEGYDTLGEYEKSLTESMGTADWKKWYEKFKRHVSTSHREILKQVM